MTGDALRAWMDAHMGEWVSVAMENNYGGDKK